MDFVSFNFQGKNHPLNKRNVNVLVAVRFQWQADELLFEPDGEYLQEFEGECEFPKILQEFEVWNEPPKIQQEFETASEFPNAWKNFLGFVGDNLLVAKDARSLCVRLRTLFLLNKMPFPVVDILDVRKYLTSAKFISSNDTSYENMAEAVKIAMPDMTNALERAWFIGHALAKCWSPKALKHVAPADFSEPQKLTTNYKKEGAPVVFRYTIPELFARPLATRFVGTYVAFTGTLKTDRHPKMLRKEAKETVRQLGGIATESIDEHVTHLVTGVQVAGREKSDKERTAAEDGIILIPADVFFALIGR